MDNAFKDIQNKYETQVNSNLRTGAALSELEMILEAERRKTKEIKDKLEADLEGERRMRVDFENKLIRLKDDSLKREMLLSELSFKSNNFTHENESLLAENNSLKEELVKYQELYNMKLREMEEKFNNQSRRMMILEEEYSQQLEKTKQEQKGYLDELNNDWDKRYRVLDEKQMKLLTIKQELENEIKRLNDIVLRIKVEAEETIRETVGKIQEEEYRKYMSNIKALESKLMASEENKAALARKNQEFINELQAKDRELRQSQMYMEGANNKYKQELSDLQNQFTQVEIMVSKYRTELGNKENMISRLEAEFTEMSKSLQKQKEMSKNELDNNMREFSNEKRYFEDTIDQQKRKMMEMEAALSQRDSEFSRVKAEYERICNMLQNNINKTIFQTMTDASYPIYAPKNNAQQSRIGGAPGGNRNLENSSNKLVFKYE